MNQNTKGLYLNEHVIRFVAAQVIFLTGIAIFEQWGWLAVFISLDFGIRAFTSLPSPLAAFSKKIAEAVKLNPKPVFAPPKRFAAALGFVFSLAITLLIFLQLTSAAYIVGAILIACALLESVFKICLGCYVYNWVVLPVQNKLSGGALKNQPLK